MEPDSAEEIKAQRIRFLINTLVAVGIVGGTFIIFALTWAYGYNPPKSHLTILYTNDFHGQLYPNSTGYGGSARIATLVSQTRSSAKNFLLLDAGDVFFSAPAVSQMLLGQSTIDIYNMLGYNATTIGNHEWDRGYSVLQTRVAQSNFAWLSANLVINGTDWNQPSWVQPYKIFQVGVASVGVIGLSPVDTADNVAAGYTNGYTFKPFLDTVLHYYDTVKASCDFVMLLAHGNFENTTAYAGLTALATSLKTAGKVVPLIIAGHAHATLSTPLVVGNTMLVEAGYSGGYLEIDLYPDSDYYKITPSLNLITGDAYAENTTVKNEVDYWYAQILPTISRVVGSTSFNLTNTKIAESQMGNLVADAMLYCADSWDNAQLDNSVVLALQQPNGIRSAFSCVTGPCDITAGDTFNALPNGNNLTILTLTGQQIVDILTQGATLAKGLMQVSATISYQWSAAGVSNVQILGSPVVLNATYTAATNSYISGGKDGWTTFLYATNVQYTQVVDWDCLNSYISTGLNGVVSASNVATGRAVQLPYGTSSAELSSNMAAPLAPALYLLSILLMLFFPF